MRDFYEVLGVARNASPDDLKRAYRALARANHPDANPGDPNAEERFKEINLAYETLSDPDRRRRYDMFGPEGAAGADAGFGFGQGGFGGPGGFNVGFGDIFEAFFGGGGGGFGAGGYADRASGGADIGVDAALSFEDAVFGCEREVQIRVQAVCDTCTGSGAEPGTSPETCPTCRGRGEVQTVRRTVLGQIVTTQACPDCGGVGSKITSPCRACRGDGRLPEQRTLTVKIPPGVDDGAQLRLTGRGDAGVRGAPPGDLYVRMRVAPPPVDWERRGADLHHRLRIPVTTAALGGQVTFTSLEGEDIVCDVNPGTTTGHSIRHRHKGAPQLRGGSRGDLHVELVVETPQDLDAEQTELLRRLAELRGENIDAPGVVRRIKNVFR